MYDVFDGDGLTRIGAVAASGRGWEHCTMFSSMRREWLAIRPTTYTDTTRWDEDMVSKYVHTKCCSAPMLDIKYALCFAC